MPELRVRAGYEVPGGTSSDVEHMGKRTTVSGGPATTSGIYSLLLSDRVVSGMRGRGLKGGGGYE